MSRHDVICSSYPVPCSNRLRDRSISNVTSPSLTSPFVYCNPSLFTLLLLFRHVVSNDKICLTSLRRYSITINSHLDLPYSLTPQTYRLHQYCSRFRNSTSVRKTKTPCRIFSHTDLVSLTSHLSSLQLLHQSLLWYTTERPVSFKL